MYDSEVTHPIPLVKKHPLTRYLMLDFPDTYSQLRIDSILN